MRAFVPFASAASLLLISVYLLSTILVMPKQSELPLPLEILPSSSLTNLHDEMVKGSIELEVSPIKKEPENSWSLPPKVHFIWIGPNVIKDKYVKNINNFSKHNPDYQVWKSEKGFFSFS